MPAGLSSKQYRVAKRIWKVGRRKKAPRKHLLSALATAAVEANFSNPSYGHADSVGWRQERSHYGSVKRRRNVRGAARRYYSEAKAADRGQSPWSLSQDVQRSAFPSRYKQESGTAKRVLKTLNKRELGKGRGKGGRKRRRKGQVIKAGKKTKVVRGTTKKLKFQKGQSNQVARARILQNFVSTPREERNYIGLASQLGAAADVPGSVRTVTKPTKQKVKVGTTKRKQRSRGKRARGKGGRRGIKSGGGWAGSQKVAGYAARIAKRRGISVSSRKRTSTLGNPSSDHYVGNKNAYAVDLSTSGTAGKKLAKAIARRYGVKFRMNSYSSGGTIKDRKGKKFRIQILYGSGIAHGDHVHVGVRRA